MRWLLRLLLAGVLLLPVGALMGLWLAVQDEPLVVNEVALTPDHIARARRIMDRHDPRRMRPLDAGETFTVPGLSVRAVASAHELLETDELGQQLYLGFLFETAGVRCYHSGDTVAYDGLAKALGPQPIDALFLPINGRDPTRGVAGNMSAAEAVVLAAQVRARVLVPHHYDMFTFNTVPVETVVEAAKAVRLEGYVQAKRCGECWYLKARPPA